MTVPIHDDRDPVVRVATVGDLDELADLLTQLHPRYAATTNEDTLSQILADPQRSLLVAERNGKVLGTADVVVARNLTHGGRPWAIVENVVVDADQRGGGIGKLLMDGAG
jgi:N-acetylglutamate synthase-like GNAT family acetyltransferase